MRTGSRHLRRTSLYRRRRIAVLSALCFLTLLIVLVSEGTFASPTVRSGAYDHSHVNSSLAARPPFRVVSASYSEPSPDNLGMDDISVRFSAPLANGDRNPILEPSLPGKWVRSDGTVITFHPVPGYVATAAEKVVVPAGIRSKNSGDLKTPVEYSLPSVNPEVLRMQEVLADLKYLPVQFKSSLRRQQVFGNTSEIASFTQPPSGTFAWRWPDTPQTLKNLWHPGNYGVVTQGAVMAFERTHRMIVNRVLSSGLVKALAGARLAHSVDPDPYGYVQVSEARPEILTVFQDGSPAFRSLANTGIDNSTPIGTWPIYLRLSSQTLKGTYPNGIAYDIPGVRYLNYFDGNFAVHAFSRSSYGFPQSAGCVELPLNAAAKVWKYVHYGTLVTVT